MIFWRFKWRVRWMFEVACIGSQSYTRESCLTRGWKDKTSPREESTLCEYLTVGRFVLPVPLETLLVEKNGRAKALPVMVVAFFMFGCLTHPSSWALDGVVLQMEVKTWKWGTVTLILLSEIYSDRIVHLQHHSWSLCGTFSGWVEKQERREFPFWSLLNFSSVWS